ncbi:single-stranded DNA-binding protein [Kineosporia sp. J2-2]|uniref:Single-stranded DNA-binding protein n=1 Tax=Kineosporia corallincola TaxID=2835133 RepID=A0ABS5TE46_9ACTN|nr:single-stranded DNA-binding protein [Kineosporia corallincola]MBT0769353.1 single-stranded DNA-binding protein [Kineosporia corallincola]
MNDIQVVLRGNIASDPRFVRFDDGNCVTSFRLASTSSWFDREHNTWVDRRTTFVSVNCRRALATSALQSLHKGHPVVITGRLWERSWAKEERSGRTLEVEAETVGHDLTFGVSAFTRFTRRHAGQETVIRDGQPIEPSDANAAAVYEAVREIEAPVADVSGFHVLEDDPEDAVGGGISVSRAR